MNKQLTTIVLSRYFVQISFILPIIVIPLGFEPKTHSLEGCCSNPTELRNQHFSIRKNSLTSAIGQSNNHFLICGCKGTYIF